MHRVLFLVFFLISGYGAVPLLMSFTSKIKLIEDSGSKNQTTVASSSHHVIAVDYHLARGEVYFTVGTGRIMRSFLRPNRTVNTPTIIAEVKLADGIAVDWIHDNLYWTDVSRQVLEVSDLDGLHRKELLNATHGLDKPRAIVIDPAKGLLFWSDWGRNSRVESLGLDGKKNKTVVSDVLWPNGLTLDLARSKLYIMDSLLSTISSCNYDGSDYKTLVQSPDTVQKGFGISFYEDSVYWNSWHNRSLYKMNINDVHPETIIHQEGLNALTERMMGLKAVDISLQPRLPPTTQDPCKSSGCSHRCLISKDLTPTCYCPFGFKLSSDRKTCDEEGYLLVSWRKSIRRYSLDGNNDQWLFDGATAAVSISYHLSKGLVFWSDVEEHRIYRAHLDQLNNKTVIATPETCDGLVVDWIHDVLYWTDNDRNTIEAADLNGNKHITLFDQDLDQPRDIAVDPIARLLFWTDWGERPKIERSTLDGLERKVIIDSSHLWPNGLTVDIPSQKIYYVDGKIGFVYSCLYDGSKNDIIFAPPPIKTLQLFAITNLNQELFWTDWETKAFYRSPKGDITVARSIAASSSMIVRPHGIKAVHSSLQEKRENPCSKVHCQSLCLGTQYHTAHCMGEDSPSDNNDLRMELPADCENPNVYCDGRKDCPDGKDEDVDRCAAIENVVVYKKNQTALYFKVKVTDATRKQLTKFVGDYSNENSDKSEHFETPAVPCVMWPEAYCFHLSSLKRRTAYNILISAVQKGGKVGNKHSVDAVTKEEVSEPPEHIRVIKHNETCLIYQWHHPKQGNGMIKSFIINIDETETFDSEKCCQSFPIIELPVFAEEPVYETATTGLTPASTYAVSISPKNMYVGMSGTITANTPPPPMKVLRIPTVQVSSLIPLSWQPTDDQGESPLYHSLIRSYMLLLIPPANEPYSHGTKNKLNAELLQLLESKVGERFVVLWDEKVEDSSAFQSPIKVDTLTTRKQYKFAWVQVSQYKDSYSVDLLHSDPFIPV